MRRTHHSGGPCGGRSAAEGKITLLLRESCSDKIVQRTEASPANYSAYLHTPLRNGHDEKVHTTRNSGGRPE